MSRIHGTACAAPGCREIAHVPPLCGAHRATLTPRCQHPGDKLNRPENWCGRPARYYREEIVLDGLLCRVSRFCADHRSLGDRRSGSAWPRWLASVGVRP